MLESFQCTNRADGYVLQILYYFEIVMLRNSISKIIFNNFVTVECLFWYWSTSCDQAIATFSADMIELRSRLPLQI